MGKKDKKKKDPSVQQKKKMKQQEKAKKVRVLMQSPQEACGAESSHGPCSSAVDTGSVRDDR